MMAGVLLTSKEMHELRRRRKSKMWQIESRSGRNGEQCSTKKKIHGAVAAKEKNAVLQEISV
jgi:hypothetical protein